MTIRLLVTLFYVLVGVVNLLPVVGVLGVDRLEALYGFSVAGEELPLLLRHRAVLFGLLGAFIVLAAFRTQWRPAATLAGLVSMLSFAALALPIEAHNEAMQRVFWIDVGAIVLLLTAYGLSKIRQ
jgi:hypothetical protein